MVARVIIIIIERDLQLMSLFHDLTEYIYNVTEYDVTNISGTQPEKNIITMGKVDTSDFMMIIT